MRQGPGPSSRTQSFPSGSYAARPPSHRTACSDGLARVKITKADSCGSSTRATAVRPCSTRYWPAGRQVPVSAFQISGTRSACGNETSPENARTPVRQEVDLAARHAPVLETEIRGRGKPADRLGIGQHLLPAVRSGIDDLPTLHRSAEG